MRSRWPWVGAHQLECLRWFRPRSLTSFEWSRDHAWNSARRQWGKQKQGDTSRHDSNKPADGQVNEEAGWWPWYGWSHGQGLICWDLLKQVVMHSAIYSLHEVLDRDLPRAPFHTEVAMRAAAFVILYWSESLCTSYFNFVEWGWGSPAKGQGKPPRPAPAENFWQADCSLSQDQKNCISMLWSLPVRLNLVGTVPKLLPGGKVTKVLEQERVESRKRVGKQVYC